MKFRGWNSTSSLLKHFEILRVHSASVTNFDNLNPGTIPANERANERTGKANKHCFMIIDNVED